MRIKFWGTRGSTPVPGKDTIIYGGNTTCVEIGLKDGKKVVIDAGTGIRSLGNEYESRSEPVDIYLLMTHIHWDHILGFPFFFPIYKSSTKIQVDGYSQGVKGLRYSFDNRMGDGFFPIRFEELKSNIQFANRLTQGYIEVDGTRIDSIPLRHPQGGLGFRFREDDKTLVFLTDNELELKGESFDHYVRFCKAADILIHDSQFMPEEMSSHRGWGHTDYESAMQLALQAGVGKLILFHHAPERKDSDLIKIAILCQDYVKDKNSSLEVEPAKENSVLKL